MIINHKNYLDLAFHLAEKNLGQTKLNPSVGSVVVKNDTIILQGDKRNKLIEILKEEGFKLKVVGG